MRQLAILLICLLCVSRMPVVASANLGPADNGISAEPLQFAPRGSVDAIVIPAECAEIVVRPAFVWFVLYVATGGKSEHLPDLGKYLRQSMKCMADHSGG